MDERTAVQESCTRQRDALIALSHRIHAHPELGFEEEQASHVARRVAGRARASTSRRGVCDLPTAFSRAPGRGPLHIAHLRRIRLPARASATPADTTSSPRWRSARRSPRREVADDVGLTITVIGTPAEEVGNAGGKILLLERGAFDGIHAAMMVHPAPFDMSCAADHRGLDVRRPLHRQGSARLGLPRARHQRGRRPDRRADGDRPAAPAHPRTPTASTASSPTAATRRTSCPRTPPRKYIVRVRNARANSRSCARKVHRCFEAGALATGAKLEIAAATSHTPRCATTTASPRSTGATPSARPHIPGPRPSARRACAARPTWATSRSPCRRSIPLIGINSLPAVNHQPEFAAHCVTPDADQAVYDGALAMAWTAVDLARDSAVAARLMGRATRS